MEPDISPDASRSEETNDKSHKPKKEKKKKDKSDPEHKAKKEKHKKQKERDRSADEGGDDGGGEESAAAVKRDQDRRYSLMIQGSGDVDGGPGLQYMAFVVMDDLADKLKLLDYERDFCKPLKMKPLSRHYFVYSFNVGEQFYLFTSLAAWLLRRAGRHMEQPQEYDDPNVTISTILDHCRQLELHVDFPPSRLKQGSGEQVIYVIDRLADHALRTVNFQWEKPEIPPEEVVKQEEDEAEITTEKVDEHEEDVYSEEEEEGAVLNLEDLKNLSIQGLNVHMDMQKPEDILESTTNTEEWRLEMERVLPQLRVQVRTDTRDWRNHLDQMHNYRSAIDESLSQTQSQLDRLHSDVSGTLDKIVNREKYLNSQLEHSLADYRGLVDDRDSTQEQYRSVSGGVVERSRQLAQLTDELESVKQELEERGTSMTDGTPLVNIRKALNRIKQEVQGMDVRIGVVEHTLLQYRLRDKEALQQEANVQFTANSIGLY
ncbi:intraflagellar transport protein 57 homolog [Amphibalanus amphitrite]|uniref:LOW QUALITY PROTEIN: intraflagellar transport protein 57 homolog n=1 Tax=Amphibalanus amphitrite TaxID=1232801 RepID=UPI001C913DF2|nr:LOW QUALITY PROTEIN: intraflagellar transport protein 57 homolog [Amphibalanus amphitrite]XP_043219622.1 intraflagellar transport protein 57 homolog [Amphibalanus amphitrite]XP_043219623.1 intraflagellar transport protein 57 homolog [Amphibalanus amphitrite]